MKYKLLIPFMKLVDLLIVILEIYGWFVIIKEIVQEDINGGIKFNR
jgi:hypothetical protein